MSQNEPIQLDLWRSPEECEMIAMRETIERIRISQDKVRKRLFADHGKLRGGFEDLSERLAIIERSVCRG